MTLCKKDYYNYYYYYYKWLEIIIIVIIIIIIVSTFGSFLDQTNHQVNKPISSWEWFLTDNIAQNCTDFKWWCSFVLALAWEKFWSCQKGGVLSREQKSWFVFTRIRTQFQSKWDDCFSLSWSSCGDKEGGAIKSFISSPSETFSNFSYGPEHLRWYVWSKLLHYTVSQMRLALVKRKVCWTFS